jgi:PHD/YefM family antitoxin component YafN of YafNO toxin-antitoxin module
MNPFYEDLGREARAISRLTIACYNRLQMKRKKTAAGIRKSLEKSILVHAALGEPCVIVPRNAVPARCVSLEEYERIQLAARRRKSPRPVQTGQIPDPLGAVKLGRVLGTLSRSEIYG